MSMLNLRIGVEEQMVMSMLNINTYIYIYIYIYIFKEDLKNRPRVMNIFV